MEFDRFGFAIFSDSRDPDVGNRVHEYSSAHKVNNGSKSFSALLDAWDSESNGFTKKLKKAIRHGVPNSLRACLWKKLLNSDILQKTSAFSYKANLVAVREQLVDLGVSEFGGNHCLDILCNMNCDDIENGVKHGQMHVKHIRQIMLDLDRSYPTHRLFMGNTGEAKEGRASLFRVLSVYARYNPAVGYCQGMGFIAGMLLMQMSEEESFWCMVAMFERCKYLLGYFDSSLSRIQTHAKVFQRVVQQRLPQLHQHFEDLGLHPLMYVTPWFMCLFTSLPCWDTVLAIWDKILLEGTWTIFLVALSIMEVYSDELLQVKDLANLLPRLLHLSPTIVNRNFLMAHVWECTLEKWELDSLQSIVQEEETEVSHRKRRRTENSENIQSRAKRRKSQTGESQPPSTSVFKKIFNMFAQSFDENVEDGSVLKSVTETDQSQQNIFKRPGISTQKKHLISQPRGSAQRRKVKRAIRFNSPGSVQFTKMNSPACNFENSRLSPGLATPLRRSPRIAFQKWRDVNTPSEKRLVSRDATVQYSFKSFHTPTPLRKSQRHSNVAVDSPCTINLGPLQITSPNYLSSPEIELRPMTRWRRSSSKVKIVL